MPQRKTFAVSHHGKGGGLTLDWQSGFSLAEGADSAIVWQYKFSQLRGSSDDGKSKLKLHFQDHETRAIETKVSTCMYVCGSNTNTISKHSHQLGTLYAAYFLNSFHCPRPLYLTTYRLWLMVMSSAMVKAKECRKRVAGSMRLLGKPCDSRIEVPFHNFTIAPMPILFFALQFLFCTFESVE